MFLRSISLSTLALLIAERALSPIRLPLIPTNSPLWRLKMQYIEVNTRLLSLWSRRLIHIEKNVDHSSGAAFYKSTTIIFSDELSFTLSYSGPAERRVFLSQCVDTDDRFYNKIDCQCDVMLFVNLNLLI